MHDATVRRNGALLVIGFWRAEDEHGCFSNWYPSEFHYAGRRYTSVEQYMMYQKLSMFRRHDLAEKVMRADDPADCKRIGRTRIREFDSGIWEKTCKRVVKRGVKAKFRQNERMLEELLGTGAALLAECSPYDDKWGTGVGVDDPAWASVESWHGRNLLGRILMEVREELGREASSPGSVRVDEGYYLEAIPEWGMYAGELSRIPQYHQAVCAYGDTLSDSHARRSFLYHFTLPEIELMMEENMGGGLPIAGFYEMKQDVYETARYLRC